MRHSFRLLVIGATAATPLYVATAAALTLEQALELARERAPHVLAARLRVDEARARVVGASTWTRDNPVVDAAVGPRRRDGGETSTDHEVGITQTFEVGGRRGARIASARAVVAREAAAAEDTVRRHLAEVATAFFRVVAARERVALENDAARIGDDLAATLERRFAAGDLSALDRNVGTAAAARARSDARAAAAEATLALGTLRTTLGLDAATPLAVEASLAHAGTYDLDGLLAGLDARPDLQALAAELGEADADAALARSMRWPDVGIGARHEREDDADIVLGVVSVALPIFVHGQELQASADARHRRVRAELIAARTRAEIEVRAAYDAFRQQADAAAELTGGALPRLADNDGLARRSWEAGEIGLAELLAVRRDAAETRRAALARLLDARLAGIELESRAGVLR